MSDTENNKNILDLVINQDPQAVQAAFGDAITNVIADKLDDRKVELAKEMFSIGDEQPAAEQPEQEPEIEDAEVDSDDDEIEGEELTDDEWNELIASLEDEEAQEDNDQPTDDESEQEDDE